jgi:hypothetical protein
MGATSFPSRSCRVATMGNALQVLPMAGPASHPVYERGFIGLRVLSEHVEHNADPSAIAPDLPKYHGDGAPAHIARCAAIEKEGHRGTKSLAEKTRKLPEVTGSSEIARTTVCASRTPTPLRILREVIPGRASCASALHGPVPWTPQFWRNGPRFVLVLQSKNRRLREKEVRKRGSDRSLQ